MINSFDGINPQIHDDSFIAGSADIIGDVIIEENVSIWFGTVVRADGNTIKIGRGSNIQDNSVIHINPGENPTIIGENVTVGHGTIIHGATLGNNCLIGMGSIILDGAEIGENSIVGAGSLVPQGKKIPSGVLCLGSPPKIVRELTNEEVGALKKSAQNYVELSKKYKINESKV